MKCESLYNNYIKSLTTSDSLLSLSSFDNNTDIELSKYVFNISMYGPSRVMKSLQYITEANVIETGMIKL